MKQKLNAGVFIFLVIFGSPRISFSENQTILWTLGNWKMQIEGTLEVEFVDTQEDKGTLDAATTDRDGTKSMLRIDKFVLDPIFTYDQNFELRAQLEFDEDDTTFIKEWGFYVKDIHPLVSLLGVEFDDRFIKPKRLLENYGLLGTAFWRDDSPGLIYKGGHQWVYWISTLKMGYELDDKSVNESSDFELLHDDRNVDVTDGSISGLKEVGVGFGMKPSLGKWGKIDLLGFWYHHDLTRDDITFLRGITNYPASNKKNRWRSGVTFIYDIENFHHFFQTIWAKDGVLDRWGIQIQPSYKIPFKYPYLKSIRPVVEYSYLGIEGMGVATRDARTWDREKLVGAAIFEFVPSIKLKAEYSWNFEETGGPNVDNNEFLAQIKVDF